MSKIGTIVVAWAVLSAEASPADSPCAASELVAKQATEHATVAAAAPSAEPLGGAELRAEANRLLRLEASTKGPDRQPALRGLVDLYGVLSGDTTLTNSERTRLVRKIRYRLARAARRLARQNEQQRVPANVAAPPNRPSVLAQQFGLGGQFGPVRPRVAARQGGALRPVVPNAPADNGPQLVDLIQRTIAPDTWDINGGLGSIYYYRPLRVLVISQ